MKTSNEKKRLAETRGDVSFVVEKHGNYDVIRWLGLDLDPEQLFYNDPDLGPCRKMQYVLGDIPLMEIDISLISKN